MRLIDKLAGQGHWSERWRATSAANADALGRPRRSLLSFNMTLLLATTVQTGCQSLPMGFGDYVPGKTTEKEFLENHSVLLPCKNLPGILGFERNSTSSESWYRMGKYPFTANLWPTTNLGIEVADAELSFSHATSPVIFYLQDPQTKKTWAQMGLYWPLGESWFRDSVVGFSYTTSAVETELMNRESFPGWQVRPRPDPTLRSAEVSVYIKMFSGIAGEIAHELFKAVGVNRALTAEGLERWDRSYTYKDCLREPVVYCTVHFENGVLARVQWDAGNLRPEIREEYEMLWQEHLDGTRVDSTASQ